MLLTSFSSRERGPSCGLRTSWLVAGSQGASHEARPGDSLAKEPRTDGVVFEHSHEGRRPWALEGVEEAGHRHGDEAGVDEPCLDCQRVSLEK